MFYIWRNYDVASIYKNIIYKSKNKDNVLNGYLCGILDMVIMATVNIDGN